MTRILINGADNFIGSRLLTCLAHRQDASLEGIRTGDTAALLRALPGCDAVLHCASGRPADVENGARILYAALTATPAATPRVVHLSSMTVYGSAEGKVDENGETIADLGAYSAAQLAAEAQARAQPNTVVLRAGVEYGPGCAAWSERVERWLRARRLGDLGAAGDGVCNLIFIDDLLEVFVAALDMPQATLHARVFNVAMRNPPTWNEYFIRFALALRHVPLRRVTSRRLRLESTLLAIPLKILERVASRIGIDASLVPPAIPPSLLALCRQQISLDVRRVEQILGVRWTALETALTAYARSRSPESQR